MGTQGVNRDCLRDIVNSIVDGSRGVRDETSNLGLETLGLQGTISVNESTWIQRWSAYYRDQLSCVNRNVFGESTILGDAACVEVLTENSLSTPTIETSVAL